MRGSICRCLWRAPGPSEFRSSTSRPSTSMSEPSGSWTRSSVRFYTVLYLAGYIQSVLNPQFPWYNQSCCSIYHWNHWHLTILNVYLDWLEHFEFWQLGQWINHATTCLLWCNWFIGEPGIHGEDQGGWALHGGLRSSRLGLKSIFTKNFESGWRVWVLVAALNFQLTSDWAWCFVERSVSIFSKNGDRSGVC